jgi:hypothetical protein
MAGGGERLDDRSAVLPAEQPDSRSTWTPRRPVRRALIAAYLLTLAALATVGWIDALNGGARQSDPTGTLWVAPLIVTLVQVAQQGYQWALHSAPATAGRTPTRRTGMLAIAYGFCILASAATALLAVALYLPVDRFLGNTSRMAWLAIAMIVVYLMWMLPNIVIAWMEPDPGSRSVTAGRAVDP